LLTLADEADCLADCKAV